MFLRGPMHLSKAQTHASFIPALATGLFCSFVFFFGARPAGAQATETIIGVVVDATTGEPIRDATVGLQKADGTPIEGIGVEAVTDANGRFQLNSVPGGQYLVQVWHLAYGIHRHAVLVEGSGTATIQISLSQTAIRLAPLQVEAERTPESDRRRSASSGSVALRAEIVDAARSGTGLIDFMRQRFSGIQLRLSGQVGFPTCLEFRQLRIGGQCRVPIVHVDGMAISSSSALQTLTSLQLLGVHRIEVIPPSYGAAGSYGLDGAWGVIVVETYARADLGSSLVSTAPTIRELQAWYDWRLEANRYPWTGVYAAAFAGNAVGLAAGLAAVGQCVDLETGVLRTRETRQFGRRAYRCHPSLVVATGLLATVLPAVGGAMTARMAGATDLSTGATLYSALASQAVFIPAAVIFITGTNGRPVGPGEVAGLVLVTLGAPLLNTLVDRFFRVLR